VYPLDVAINAGNGTPITFLAPTTTLAQFLLLCLHHALPLSLATAFPFLSLSLRVPYIAFAAMYFLPLVVLRDKREQKKLSDKILVGAYEIYATVSLSVHLFVSSPHLSV
jgi:hypothetical protein